VITLLVFCYYRVLFTPSDQDRVRTPLEIDTYDSEEE
jgi:hypothetical protein